MARWSSTVVVGPVARLAPPSRALAARRYGLSLALTSLALIAALVAEQWGDEASPFPLFLAAVMLSSWYGGVGPGLLSIGIGAVAIFYFFISPVRTLEIATLTGALQLAVAVLVALLINSLNVRRQRAEARYRGLFDGGADAILVTDAAGSVIDANPATTALLGIERDALLRARGNDLADDWPVATIASLANGDHADGRWRGELDIRRQNGQTIPVEALITAVDLPSSTAYLATLREISERRRLDRMQEDFLASVSHDLRTPLTAIRTGVVLLEASAADRLRADERTLLGHARTNSERLSLLIDDLLALNQIKAGTLPLDREPFDLREAVMAAVAAVHAPIHEKKQVLDLLLPGELRLDGDQRRLEQAIVNLLSNAHRHTPSGAQVTVVGCVAEREVCLTVRDDGPGVPAIELEAIFERFHRISAQESGSGLGLPIARGIVELHGGRNWDERPPGGGTAIHVVLPRSHE